MAKAESGLDEIKRSRDYYIKEIRDQERKIEGLLQEVEAIRQILPQKQKILDELNDIIKRLEEE